MVVDPRRTETARKADHWLPIVPGTDVYLALANLYRTRGEIGRAIHIHQNVLLRQELPEALRREALESQAARLAEVKRRDLRADALSLIGAGEA